MVTGTTPCTHHVLVQTVQAQSHTGSQQLRLYLVFIDTKALRPIHPVLRVWQHGIACSAVAPYWPRIQIAAAAHTPRYGAFLYNSISIHSLLHINSEEKEEETRTVGRSNALGEDGGERGRFVRAVRWEGECISTSMLCSNGASIPTALPGIGLSFGTSASG